MAMTDVKGSNHKEIQLHLPIILISNYSSSKIKILKFFINFLFITINSNNIILILVDETEGLKERLEVVETGNIQMKNFASDEVYDEIKNYSFRIRFEEITSSEDVSLNIESIKQKSIFKAKCCYSTIIQVN